MPGPSPTPDLMDPLGLFTHGEFLDYDNPDPELLLFTQGEFPRAIAVVVFKGPGPTAAARVGSPSRRRPEDDLEEWAIVLLLLDE